ncbi:MAG: hypothetical protein EPN75_01710 [Beijerinckiaceae bacterium]|nr:MAG: hypothetical protein EPN75_01710 [Beijerinckiaceae bacterium]
MIQFLALPESARRAIYTMNVIEALDAKLRRAARTKDRFQLTTRR